MSNKEYELLVFSEQEEQKINDLLFQYDSAVSDYDRMNTVGSIYVDFKQPLTDIVVDLLIN
jgi:hypothetical protein